MEWMSRSMWIVLLLALAVGFSACANGQSSGLTVADVAGFLAEHAPTPIPPKYPGCPRGLALDEVIEGSAAEVELGARIHWKGAVCKEKAEVPK